MHPIFLKELEQKVAPRVSVSLQSYKSLPSIPTSENLHVFPSSTA